MRMLVIAPVPEPKSFTDCKFTAAEYAAAKKAGEKTVPAVTAKEAVKNSKGLYRIKLPAAEVKELPKLPDPTDMSNEALFAEMAMYGKAPQKQMARSKVVEFIRDLRAKSASLIVDDEE